MKQSFLFRASLALLISSLGFFSTETSRAECPPYKYKLRSNLKTICSSSNVASPQNIGGQTHEFPQISMKEVVSKGKRRLWVNKGQLMAYLTSRLESSRLKGCVPPDAKEYGIDKEGSVKSWVSFLTRLAEVESSFDALTVNKCDEGGSLGIFQVSVLDGARYPSNKGKNWTEEELFCSPAKNAHTAVAIFEKNLFKENSERCGYIVKPGQLKGAGGYFAGTSMEKIRNKVKTEGFFTAVPKAIAAVPETIVEVVNVGVEGVKKLIPPGESTPNVNSSPLETPKNRTESKTNQSRERRQKGSSQSAR